VNGRRDCIGYLNQVTDILIILEIGMIRRSRAFTRTSPFFGLDLKVSLDLGIRRKFLYWIIGELWLGNSTLD